MWSAKFNLIHHRLYFSALLSLVLLTSIPEVPCYVSYSSFIQLLLWLAYISGTNASGLMLELWIELAILMLEVFVHIVVYLNVSFSKTKQFFIIVSFTHFKPQQLVREGETREQQRPSCGFYRSKIIQIFYLIVSGLCLAFGRFWDL